MTNLSICGTRMTIRCGTPCAADRLRAAPAGVRHGIDLSDKYTVDQAARDFLADGTRQLAPSTLAQLRFHAERWIIPGLGNAKLKKLRADDVDA
jgi:hypothetical protein